MRTWGRDLPSERVELSAEGERLGEVIKAWDESIVPLAWAELAAGTSEPAA